MFNMTIVSGRLPILPFNENSMIVFTSNSSLTRDRRLVMGRGAALSIRDAYPGLDSELGDIVYRTVEALGDYGLLCMKYEGTNIGAFQVKRHYILNARLDLLMKSTEMLIEVANQYERIDMNFPGIGLGRMKVDTVENIICGLPDNVYVWKWKPGEE